MALQSEGIRINDKGKKKKNALGRGKKGDRAVGRGEMEMKGAISGGERADI